MLGTVKKYRSRVAVLAFAAMLPMLMAPTGGIPSRPVFQTVTTGNKGPLQAEFTDATLFAQKRGVLFQYANDDSFSQLFLTASGGTPASPIAAIAERDLGALSFGGQGDASTMNIGASIIARANEAYSVSPLRRGTYVDHEWQLNGNVGKKHLILRESNVEFRDGVAADFFDASNGNSATISNTGSTLAFGNVSGTTAANFSGFTSFTVTGATAGGRAHRFDNTSNSTSAYSQIAMYNDANRGAYLLHTGSTWTGGSIVTGGPSGEQYLLNVEGAFPISLATNGVERVRVAGDGSSINLQATAVQANGSNVCTANGTNCPSSVTHALIKGSTTSRTSTTALTIDPDLQFVAGASADYKIEFCFYYNGTTTGTQGIKFAFNRGSAGSNFFMWQGASTSTGTGTSFATTGAGSPASTTSLVSIATTAVAASRDYMCGNGTLNAVSGITYGVEWAQVSSNANATNLIGGSWLRATRLN
jgi:hypothetical protein